ncbi:Rv3654c family TadE-like protein [Sanguibacter sp. HDW7]|uniref:Rv3654c family TadE-like protein n=1 Tax=Sanguibacter sp. HDW7 TaxID=2714931 RepID=UPI00351AC540
MSGAVVAVGCPGAGPGTRRPDARGPGARGPGARGRSAASVRRKLRAGTAGAAHDDAGSASVLVLAVLAVAVVLAGTLALAASARALGAATSSAADLAALAGAQAAAATWRGDAPCAVATEAARRNGAELVTCDVDALGVVEVGVRRAPTGALARLTGPRSATARAGPAWVRDAELAGAR